MDFNVCTVHGGQGLEALPVAKIVSYPLEDRDYRPFAQNIICLDGDSLILRMWAFEVSPPLGSELRALIFPFAEDSGLGLLARFVMDGDDAGPAHSVELIGSESGAVEAEYHSRGGEDLQGIYWGGELRIPLAELERRGGRTLTRPGDRFKGNFYKLCDLEGRVQRGSFFPADWSGPYNPESMGCFAVVSF
jgi:hypothetical protein